jgi:4-amino-4-deoxy-L-arabinose transferase-like glycosyltransferase
MLRGVEVVSGNYLFGFDHGRDYLAAYNIAELGKLTLIGPEIGAGAAGINGIFHGPGYFYLLAIMYKLFGGDPYGGLLLMFMFGVGTLIVTYLTTRKMFGSPVALLSFLLVAVSPLIVSQSRFIWNHHSSSFFVVLSLYFAYMIAKRPRLYAPLAVFTAGIIYHFELAIAVPMVIAMFVGLPLVWKIWDWRVYVYAVVAALGAFSPFILFEWRHGWQAFRSAVAYLQQGGGSGISSLVVAGHAQNYLDNARNSFIYGNGYVGERVFNVLAIAMLFGLIWLAAKATPIIHRLFFRFLLLLVVVSYGIFMLLNNQVWDYYLIHAHFVYLFVFAYIFVYLLKLWRKSHWAKVGIVFLSFFFVQILWASGQRMVANIRYDYWDFGGVEKIKGKKMAIDYVYTDAAGQPFSEFSFMPPIYTYPFDYLFLTYGKNTYGYIPGTEKKGLVYLIIEQDNAKPWTYKGWLETVIVGGDIIDTVTLPSGHIIQKRMFSP